MGASCVQLGFKYDELYKELLAKVGKSSDYNGAWLGWDDIGQNSPHYMSVYNHSPIYAQTYELNKIAWLFQVSERDDFSVNSDRLLSYMQTYSARHGTEVLGKYSADLFADRYVTYWLDYLSVENGPKNYDITPDDTFTLIGSNRKATFWDFLSLGATFDRSESEPLCPIVEIAYDDIKNIDDGTISTTYLIAEKEVPAIREYLKKQKNTVTYLFRFDNSLYLNDAFAFQNVGAVGYFAQEPVFLDFDIISLGYRKDGVVTKIPVVCSPRDFIAPVEPGQEIPDYAQMLSDFLVTLLSILCGVLLFVVIIAVIVWAFKVITRKK